MNRLRMLRGLALLGAGVTSACGGRIAEDAVGPPDSETTALPPDDGDAGHAVVVSDTGTRADTFDGVADSSSLAEADVGADAGNAPMRCVGTYSGDAGVCAPGSYCWGTGSSVYCSRDAPDAGDAGARCGDGWCGGGLSYYGSWCELRGTEAICHVTTYTGAGGPLAPPELLV